MSNSIALRPLVAQFVPLLIDTASDDYREWSQKYRGEGDTIPKVFVIRADGEQLYGESASPSGTELRAFLERHLALAGRPLSEAELARVAETMEKVLARHEAGDIAEAVALLKPLLGSGSYARDCVAADELGEELVAKATDKMEAADKQLEEGESLAGTLALVQVQRFYGRLPALTQTIGQRLRTLRGDNELRSVLEQARALDRAAEQVDRGNTSRAVAQYRRVVANYPDTDAAALAEDELAALAETADTATTASKPSGPPTEAALKKAASYLRLARSFAEKRPEKAREYAEQVIDLAPDTELAGEAAALLDEL